jgi:hypothetical protein
MTALRFTLALPVLVVIAMVQFGGHLGLLRRAGSARHGYTIFEDLIS